MTDFRSFKGAAKRLEDLDLPRRAAEIGVGEDELHAFMDVEAAGTGFDAYGRPKMLFEPHVLYSLLKAGQRDRAVAIGVAYPHWGMKPYPSDSYPRLTAAMAINEGAAVQAASWGLFQILGENYHSAGYASPQAMVLDFMADEELHLEAAIQFIKAKHLDDDLRVLAALTRPTRPEDCIGIVRVYNGSGYARNHYDVKFATAHNRWRGIKDTPWTPPVAAKPAEPAAEPQRGLPAGDQVRPLSRPIGQVIRQPALAAALPPSGWAAWWEDIKAKFGWR